MESEIKEMLNETLTALERLMNLFRIERIMHIIITSVAFLMLLYAIVLLFKKQIDSTLLISLFGSSGLITYSSGRITYFFKKGFELIDDIIHSTIKSGNNHE